IGRQHGWRRQLPAAGAVMSITKVGVPATSSHTHTVYEVSTVGSPNSARLVASPSCQVNATRSFRSFMELLIAKTVTPAVLQTDGPPEQRDVGAGVGVAVTMPAVDVDVELGVAVEVGLSVAVCVAVAVAVGVVLAVMVGVSVTVGVALAVAVGVSV